MKETLTNNNVIIKKRLAYIDICKGIGMLAIIIGHLGVPSISKFLYTFHVPLFFLISGFFYKDEEGFLKKRTANLVKAYLFTSLCVIIFDVIYELAKYIASYGCSGGGIACFEIMLSTVVKWAVATAYGSGSRSDFLRLNLPVMGATWFLLASIIGMLLLHIGLRFKRYAVIFFIICFATGAITARFTWLPFSIQSGMTAAIFFYIGYLGKIKRDNANAKVSLHSKYIICCFLYGEWQSLYPI